MQDPTKVKLSALLVILSSVGCLCAALYLQIEKDWFPCPLCIVQRYAYIVTAFAAFGLLVLTNKNSQGLKKTLASVVGIGALAGLATAGYHLWVLANPGQSCGVDPLQLKLNALPWVSVWPDMFEADGFCTADYPPFLGLHLPAWSGIGLFVQAILSVVIFKAAKPASVFR